ncbi:hypothetical protein ACOSQ2_012620 [Xanthoceras sorbifolium]
MTQCPYQKEAFTWGDKEPPCLVRYADHSVSGILDLPPVLVEYFHQTWVSLMDGLVKEVSMGSSSLKFTTKKAKFNTFQKIYALMQCTPDLSLGDCDVCLRQSVAESQACCLRTIGGNVQRANCYFGWALSPFYSPHTDASPSVSTTRPQINSTVDNYNGMSTFQKYDSLKILIPCNSALAPLKFATDNFSDAIRLGQGRFGVVYKVRNFEINKVHNPKLSYPSK